MKECSEDASITFFNQYQANTYTVIKENNDSAIYNGQDLKNGSTVVIVSHQEKKSILQRRDLLLHYLESNKDPDIIDIINRVIKHFSCSKSNVEADLQALKFRETYDLHKRRLDASSAIRKAKRKKRLYAEGVKAVTYAMEECTHFDSELFENLSRQYQLRPKQILIEIYRYKQFSTQLILNKQRNVKRPFVKALFKSAKLNLYY